MTVSRYIPHTTCLVQALAVQVFLTRNGYSPQLNIGVAKTDSGQLQAHAWVECDGWLVLGGYNAECYTPLLSIIEESR